MTTLQNKIDLKIIDDTIKDFILCFKKASTKADAHRLSARIAEQASRNPKFLTAILSHYLQTPENLALGHYPVVSIPIESNPYFSLVANCWIPHPSGRSNLSTKAIHHHGDMLLSTTTIFGTGYEHWKFTPPKLVDPHTELFHSTLIDTAIHSLHHVEFVDAHVAHVPMYPTSLTVTLALWSSSQPNDWRDYVKRMRIFKGREHRLREILCRLGLKNALALKKIHYFDFVPTPKGFRGMRDRKEYTLGPNEEYLKSLFHIIQTTGNGHLTPLLEKGLQRTKLIQKSCVWDLFSRLKKEQPIEGCLSACHLMRTDISFATEEIQMALAAMRTQVC